MFVRTASALFISLILIGCAQPQPSQEEIWTAVEGCGGKELCSKASVAALRINKQAGRDFGGGVILRQAESDGRTVTIDLDVPVQVKDLPDRGGRTPKQQVGDIMKSNLCNREEMRRFFSLGGEVRMRLFLPSDEVFHEDSLTSC